MRQAIGTIGRPRAAAGNTARIPKGDKESAVQLSGHAAQSAALPTVAARRGLHGKPSCLKRGVCKADAAVTSAAG